MYDQKRSESVIDLPAKPPEYLFIIEYEFAAVNVFFL